MTVWTKEQYKAAKDALFVNEGACNGAGVARTLQEAYAAWLHTDGTTEANKSAPVCLMLHQLAYLAGGNFELVDHRLSWYYTCLDTCNQIVREYEAAQGDTDG